MDNVFILVKRIANVRFTKIKNRVHYESGFLGESEL